MGVSGLPAVDRRSFLKFPLQHSFSGFSFGGHIPSKHLPAKVGPCSGVKLLYTKYGSQIIEWLDRIARMMHGTKSSIEFWILGLNEETAQFPLLYVTKMG